MNKRIEMGIYLFGLFATQRNIRCKQAKRASLEANAEVKKKKNQPSYDEDAQGSSKNVEKARETLQIKSFKLKAIETTKRLATKIPLCAALLALVEFDFEKLG
jgi:hypothetical protein